MSMKDLPKWVKQAVTKYTCPNCHTQMTKEYISGVGVKKSSKYEDKDVCYFLYDCSKCKQSLSIELDVMTIEEFVMNMLDEYTSDQKDVQDEKRRTPNNKKKHEEKSKISNEEANAMTRILEKYPLFDDFLLQIGLTKEEIAKNNKIGKEEYYKRIKEERENKDKGNNNV